VKKLFLIGVIVGLMGWLGCGGDDGPVDPPPPTIITITAATGSVAPAWDSVYDTVWTGIASTNVPIAVSAFSSASKRRPDNALAVTSGVGVQALVVGTDLYLRLTWDDATWDCWPGRFEVTSFDYDTVAHFTQDALSFKEDQVMIFFDGGTAFGGWDVWNWRMTTTGAGYLAEGAVLAGTTLTVDPGDNDLASSNLGFGGQPEYMQPEGPANLDYRLLQSTAIAIDHYQAWSLGDFVSGWIINDSLYQQDVSTRGGRFDIDAYSRHSSGEYVVVLKRALNTSLETDLDMSSLSTVNLRLGITNNADFLFYAGSSNQGFSNTFKLSLP